MAEVLTAQQREAVENRGGKLLVSAAAGSGKTKVLVDRLLRYVTDPVSPANLDDFLIITYTKAAASELRAKIASKLSQRIAEEPTNRHLQRQMQRLYLTKISTVHAFCTDILREYAYRVDLPGDFRVADENECLELQMSILERILENAYAAIDDNPNFRTFLDTQGFGRKDDQIYGIILKVYNSARCHLLPEDWLEKCIQMYAVDDVTDISETVWGQYLISDLKRCLKLHCDALCNCIAQAQGADGMEKPIGLFRSVVSQLENLQSCETWDDICKNSVIDYGRLTFPKQVSDSDLVPKMKAIRDACKEDLAKKLRRFVNDSKQMLDDIRQSGTSLNGLITLCKEFSAAYSKAKRSRRVADFGDLEHVTLDLLVGKKRSGPTALAKEIGARFREVMVDEYQDSNEVQDAIFGALTSEKNNCFMVGDVKQSIYQFRLADPGIFLDKYNAYSSSSEAEPGQGRKVLLSNNFRSSGAVIEAVNDVFSQCMSPELGGLVYGPDEMLYEGVPHIPLDEPEVELYGINVLHDTYHEEAEFVADKIVSMLDGDHFVRDGEMLRSIKPEDIVILLRSPGSVGHEFQYALERRGIQCTTGGAEDLLSTEEVSLIRSLLQIISNPSQDIPLIAVLSSRIFGFSADDLASVRSAKRYGTFYEALVCDPSEKSAQFVALLTELRNAARMQNLTEVIDHVLVQTNLEYVFSAMPDGTIRIENIQRFIQIASDFELNGQRDLVHFLEYLNTMDAVGLPASPDKSVSGAVTIMSIHKSKGLEYPVVFLCGLSRVFNRESARAQILCDKTLGLGLSCVDTVNRVRYPSIAKHAISAKIIDDGISEEMRVLYVAMTRARDRLIMTYASARLEKQIADLVLRMDLSDPKLINSAADCPGKWVLYTALHRIEAGVLFGSDYRPKNLKIADKPWKISLIEHGVDTAVKSVCSTKNHHNAVDVEQLRQSLRFQYPHDTATQTPSKVTATQLKGRIKDQEAAEFARNYSTSRSWRAPSFVKPVHDGKRYGNAIHAIMQHIDYTKCDTSANIETEIVRLKEEGYISEETASLISSDALFNFFSSDIGRKVRTCSPILREFKFSVFEQGETLGIELDDEHVLLQGVVDCAIIEADGITIIDFKTDQVHDNNLSDLVQRYRLQVSIYAKALARIFKMPVKSSLLYFFHVNQFVDVT